ncbi:MAG: HelD family protein [Lachnospiraceae bacterium]
MNHEVYLNRVLKRLAAAVEELEQKMEFRRSEITKMQEYYWESYTEYDEYGYEKNDNDRLLREEADAHKELVKKYARYVKMMDSPYFAAITFRYDGEEEEETYYIGIGDFSPSKAEAPLICDWRAPISSLFYDYDIGRASFQAPAGEIFGDLTKKYQFKIKIGKLLYVIDSDIVVNDEVLQRELSMNANARLKSIVSTIQKEQNAIIRNEADKILVIQGSAGSGKTSVALHRVAYLLYHHRKQLSANQILILSPNPVFSEYISHILPELGEENILEMTFDLYAYRELKAYKEAEDRYHYLERLLCMSEEDAKEYQQSVQEKQSKEYVEELNLFVLTLEDSLMNFKPLSYKKLSKTEQELRTLFYEKFPDIPILSRMKTVADYVIDEEETLLGREYDVLERGIVESKLDNMYETKNLFTLYNRFLRESGRTEISELAEHIPYEDVYPMLYLKYLLSGGAVRTGIKHLIVDEMQDYSYVQFLLLGKMFSCPMTILGDREQQAAPGKPDAQELCRDVFGKKAKLLTLKKSYRSTFEISQFANEIAGIEGEEAFERHGRKPEYFLAATENEMTEKLYSVLSEENMDMPEHGREPETGSIFETTAVLTKTWEEAQKLYLALKDRLPVSLLSAESSHMEKGIVITTFYLAKGLEFDSVHVAYVQKDTYFSDYHRQILYIAATRALHELHLYGVGEKSELVSI